MKKTFKSFLNESHEELASELQGAKFIQVEYIPNKGWGISFLKDGRKKEEGGFANSNQAHDFLIRNGIDYSGKDGYIQMKEFRDKEKSKNPFQTYQQELLNFGIDKDLIQ